MRIIHTSDWHLGRRLHTADLTEDHRAFLRWLLAQAQEQQVAAVVVAGDVFDRAQPPAEAVALLDQSLADFAAAGIPLFFTSGNHDSAIRLRYGGRVMAQAGVHIRSSITELTQPLLLSDEHGVVGLYGIPYLNPDEVRDELEAERSHESVLSAAMGRIKKDAADRGLTRTIVAAHAFVRGGAASDSEREIRVGGIGDVPSAVFDGVSYVALGHLHGPQHVSLTGSATVLRYSGSPLAFSFSERNHDKSVSLVEIGSEGEISVTALPTPVRRPLRQVSGRLEAVLAGVTRDLQEAWVKVTLTDPDRMEEPMARLRKKMPHVLVLELAPDRPALSNELPSLQGITDPVEIVAMFFRQVTGQGLDEAALAVVTEAVEATVTGAAK